MIDISPDMVTEKINNGETFVLNIVTGWCPDCTIRQQPNFTAFVEKMAQHNIPVYQINVQNQPKVYLSVKHEKLTKLFGGHGFPRTALVKSGEIADSENVEVISAEALSGLAQKFIGFL